MNTQIGRIKDKLIQAKATDVEFDVFGADSHAYTLGNPLSLDKLNTFEHTYNITIPEAYKLFITEVGYSNPHEDAYQSSAAGPYYGIFPLDEAFGELETDQPEKYLSYPCQLIPLMTEEEWNTLYESVVGEDLQLSDEMYYEAIGALFGGVLPIGTQGCAITTSIILNGPYCGRIVYFDGEQKPIFAYESNFLDWYERWLDEVISGNLLSENAGWFGYSKGGTLEVLWSEMQVATTDEERLACIKALFEKTNIPTPIFNEIIENIFTQSTPVALELLRLATKTNYEEVKELLYIYAEKDLLSVLQSIYWYAKHDAQYWVELIDKNIRNVHDVETFNFCCYILTSTSVDFAHMVKDKIYDTNSEIRTQVYYSLGQLHNKADYIDIFKHGLTETDTSVLLSVLQAVSDVKDDSLLPLYDVIATTFPPSEDNYIAVNLQHCLNTFKQH